MTCIPDPANVAALQLKLEDALQQYHLLMTGQSARVVVDQNGQRVEFTAANSTRLSSYILTLKQQLGLPVNPCTSGAPLGPAGFIF